MNFAASHLRRSSRSSAGEETQVVTWQLTKFARYSPLQPMADVSLASVESIFVLLHVYDGIMFEPYLPVYANRGGIENGRDGNSGSVSVR